MSDDILGDPEFRAWAKQWHLLAPRLECTAPTGHRSVEIMSLNSTIPVRSLCRECGAAYAIVVFRRMPFTPGPRVTAKLTEVADRLKRKDGATLPVCFIPTDEPATFRAVTLDGERLDVRPGDVLTIDVLGPGQRVVT